MNHSKVAEFQQIQWNAATRDACRQLVRLAIREDLQEAGDLTTAALVPPERQGHAVAVAREDGVVAGLATVEIVLQELSAQVEVHFPRYDGETVRSGDSLAELTGLAGDLLTSERLILNLLGRLSGIATLTREYVRRVDGLSARVFDTRKTTPGWRLLEKYAVRCGGGCNHRTGLFDAVLIKDNHLAQADGLTPAEAVQRSRAYLSSHRQPDRPRLPVEVEVDTLDQLANVLPARPDIVLLDNMSLEDLARAVALRDKQAARVQLEASGGITLETVRAIAATGVDRVSVGRLTHGARSLDVGLDWNVGLA